MTKRWQILKMQKKQSTKNQLWWTKKKLFQVQKPQKKVKRLVCEKETRLFLNCLVFNFSKHNRGLPDFNSWATFGGSKNTFEMLTFKLFHPILFFSLSEKNRGKRFSKFRETLPCLYSQSFSSLPVGLIRFFQCRHFDYNWKIKKDEIYNKLISIFTISIPSPKSLVASIVWFLVTDSLLQSLLRWEPYGCQWSYEQELHRDSRVWLEHVYNQNGLQTEESSVLILQHISVLSLSKLTVNWCNKLIGIKITLLYCFLFVCFHVCF